MGGFLTQLWWGGDPDEVNAVSGLTKRDVYAVQKSWVPIFTDPAGTGAELFIRLFRAFPETRGFFRMIKDIPEEKLATNHQFKAHVINLMTSINMAVNNLHQPEVAAAMMNKLGESHRKRKIHEKHFLDFKEIIINMFTEDLKLDATTLSAWSKTINFLYKHIFETLSTENLPYDTTL